MTEAQQARDIVSADADTIVIREADPRNAASIWALYYAGRLASQPHGDLTVEKLERYFADPTSDFAGRTSKSWQDMITDTSDRHVVLAAYDQVDLDKAELAELSGESSPYESLAVPLGIAHPYINEDDERWVGQVYVASRAQGRGIARKLIENTRIWHNQQPFSLRVARHNLKAQIAYLSMDFKFNPEAELPGYYIGDVWVAQREMVHPGSPADLLH